MKNKAVIGFLVILLGICGVAAGIIFYTDHYVQAQKDALALASPAAPAETWTDDGTGASAESSPEASADAGTGASAEATPAPDAGTGASETAPPPPDGGTGASVTEGGSAPEYDGDDDDRFEDDDEHEEEDDD